MVKAVPTHSQQKHPPTPAVGAADTHRQQAPIQDPGIGHNYGPGRGPGGGPPATPAATTITAVSVDETTHTILIMGQQLTSGGPLVVTLANINITSKCTPPTVP